MRSLGSIVGGGTPSTANQRFWNGSIPWLSPADLTGYPEMYIERGKKNITEEGLERSSAVLMLLHRVVFIQATGICGGLMMLRQRKTPYFAQ